MTGESTFVWISSSGEFLRVSNSMSMSLTAKHVGSWGPLSEATVFSSVEWNLEYRKSNFHGLFQKIPAKETRTVTLIETPED